MAGFKPLVRLLALGLVVGLVSSVEEIYPSCWRKAGECLDNNEPPLDIANKVKPKENLNVVRAIENIFSLDDCLSECENNAECNYFTLYRPDPLKACSLVGFNLGNPCHRLANVCVLHRSCSVLDDTCGKACTSGRRLIKDLKTRWYTLVIGGTQEDRSQYVTKSDVVDESGKFCSLGLDTEPDEGSAGVFIQQPSGQDEVLVCGGWNDQVQYKKTCQTLAHQASAWSSSAAELVAPRAFHSMVAAKGRAYTFGGYNIDVGMLDSIEEFDGSAWSTSTVTLPTPRSHTCAVHTNFNGQDSIFVLGGWDSNLKFLPDLLKYDIQTDLSLSQDLTFSAALPADRAGVDPGRSDMACTQYRLEGWRDGILMTGGYRATGAWLNTVWFLDLAAATDPAVTDQPWTRIMDISKNFDGGRHYHGISFAGVSPYLLGGWSNKALSSGLGLNECTNKEVGKVGSWWSVMNALSVPREKFAAVSVPRLFLRGNTRC